MQQQEQEFSFKSLFVPFTTLKAIHWIIFIGIVVFANMLFNGFVWDDNGYIIKNADVHSFNLISLIKTNSFNSKGLYRPIPAIYFASLYEFFADNPLFYHFVQLVIHICNTILVFTFFKFFFKKNLSLILSIIFLIHPIQVESVSFIASSVNPMFFLFGISVLLLGIKERIGLKTQIIISFLLLLSFLTKETGVLFLPMILIYRFLYKKKSVKNILILGLVSILSYLVLRLEVGKVFFGDIPPKTIPIANLPIAWRLLNIPAIVSYYLKTFFFPFNLAIDQLWVIRTLNFNNFYFPLIVDVLFFVAVIFLGIFLYKAKKNVQVYLFFSLWFFLGLILHSQILPLDMTVAERWFYFTMVGLLGVVGSGIQLIQIKNKNTKIAAYVFCIVIIFLLSIRTIVRNANWFDPITLYSHDIQIEDNYDLENNLGEQLFLANQSINALPHLGKSVELFPYENNLYNLGVTHEDLGDIQDAKSYYYKAINANVLTTPNHQLVAQIANEGIARIMVLHDNPNDAKLFITSALNKYPKSGNLWLYLAILYYKVDSHTKAKEAIAKAYHYNQSSEISNFYDEIMNNQPLNIN